MCINKHTMYIYICIHTIYIYTYVIICIYIVDNSIYIVDNSRNILSMFSCSHDVYILNDGISIVMKRQKTS